MKTITLPRDDQNARRTFGAFVDDDGSRICETLELAWHGNAHNVSCVPASGYPLVYKWSASHKRNLWHITNVPNRDDVEIHIGNTTADTLGCVLCGSTRDGDAVDHSSTAFDRFMAVMAPFESTGAWLVITDPPAVLA